MNSSRQIFRFRLVGTHASDDHRSGRVEFSTSVPANEADGLLSFYGVSSELLAFDGPKAWYTDEPLTTSIFRSHLTKQVLACLGSDEFFHHSNPDTRYRVLSPTHIGELTRHRPPKRKDQAVAAVNNFGGRLWWFRSGPPVRNRFILHPSVELYGDPASWSRFQRWPWAFPGPPPNFRGPAGTRWWEHSQVVFLSGFKVVVCLENTSESPNYFSDKFVNAARAGCIPVYHATPSVREARLVGAKWVDPADFDFDPQATLAFALKQNIIAFQQANDAWLDSAHLAGTERAAIWQRIGELMLQKVLSVRGAC